MSLCHSVEKNMSLCLYVEKKMSLCLYVEKKSFCRKKQGGDRLRSPPFHKDVCFEFADYSSHMFLAASLPPSHTLSLPSMSSPPISSSPCGSETVSSSSALARTYFVSGLIYFSIILIFLFKLLQNNLLAVDDVDATLELVQTLATDVVDFLCTVELLDDNTLDACRILEQ